MTSIKTSTDTKLWGRASIIIKELPPGRVTRSESLFYFAMPSHAIIPSLRDISAEREHPVRVPDINPSACSIKGSLGEDGTQCRNELNSDWGELSA